MIFWKNYFQKKWNLKWIKKETIPTIINKYCEIVEFCSSKDDEINAQKYINEENDVINNNLLKRQKFSKKNILIFKWKRWYKFQFWKI